MAARTRLVFILALSIGVSACSTISKKDCVRGDWQTIGFKDGKQGYTTDRLESHAKTCAKVDVTPDAIAYQKGHQAGVLEYCTPQNGSRVGRNNDEYRGVCPEELEYGFLENYVTALRIKLDDLEIERDQVKDQLDEARDERARLGADQPVPKQLRREIDYYQSRLSNLNSERMRINDKIAKWSQKL
ncbi:MAG: DUF2799 domain-containing protein [Gammaproteobacteria bacterium]|nr:DUF2799 domain-containing protein [Gammaproteobacteria bacterium]